MKTMTEKKDINHQSSFSDSVSFSERGDVACRHLTRLLRTHQSVISTCVGPVNSSLKLLTKRIDPTHLTITTSSSLLADSFYNKSQHSDDEDNQDQHHQQVTSRSHTQFARSHLDIVSHLANACHFAKSYDAGLFLLHSVTACLVRQFSYAGDDDTCGDNLNARTVHYLFDGLCKHLSEARTASVVMRLDLNNLTFLRRLVDTSLRSKCLLDRVLSTDRTPTSQVVDSLLKTFISSFNSTAVLETHQNKLFSSIVYAYECADEFSIQTLPGVLFKIDNDANAYLSEVLRARQQRQPLKCVLFEASLSGDFASLEEQQVDYTYLIDVNDSSTYIGTNHLLVDRMKRLLDCLVDVWHVDVILCQKVIHPSLKAHLKARRVLCVDRLSLVYAAHLAELAGCQMYNDVSDDSQLTENHLGRLSSIRIYRHHAIDYVHFENEEHCLFQTVLVSVPDESYKADFENSLRVAQYSFQRTIINGVAVCGGPCFYTYSLCYTFKLIAQLLVDKSRQHPNATTLATSAAKSHAITLMKLTRHIFYSYAKCLLDTNKLELYNMSLACGHLFLMDESAESAQSVTCQCGLFEVSNSCETSLDLVAIDSGDFINWNLDRLLTFEANEHLSKLAIRVNPANVRYLDCYESKLNALKTARDILTSILNIGVFIFQN